MVLSGERVVLDNSWIALSGTHTVLCLIHSVCDQIRYIDYSHLKHLNIVESLKVEIQYSTNDSHLQHSAKVLRL